MEKKTNKEIFKFSEKISFKNLEQPLIKLAEIVPLWKFNSKKTPTVFMKTQNNIFRWKRRYFCMQIKQN